MDSFFEFVFFITSFEMDTNPQYSLGFQQSNAERRKQLHLMATFTHDPHLRHMAKKQLTPSVVYLSPQEERPFPAYSYETTSISCMKGECTKEVESSIDFSERKIKRKNMFGL